jgi:hypothetical protein
VPSEVTQSAETAHVRNVSKSNLLGRHQDSSLFRNMVNDNRQKYEQKIQAEQVTTSTETYESRQQQMRIKYGSNKNKQNYHSQRMQGDQQPQSLRKFSNPKVVDRDLNNASQASITSNSSNSAIIRLKHQELQQKQGGAVTR